MLERTAAPRACSASRSPWTPGPTRASLPARWSITCAALLLVHWATPTRWTRRAKCARRWPSTPSGLKQPRCWIASALLTALPPTRAAPGTPAWRSSWPWPKRLRAAVRAYKAPVHERQRLTVPAHPAAQPVQQAAASAPREASRGRTRRTTGRMHRRELKRSRQARSISTPEKPKPQPGAANSRSLKPVHPAQNKPPAPVEPARPRPTCRGRARRHPGRYPAELAADPGGGETAQPVTEAPSIRAVIHSKTAVC